MNKILLSFIISLIAGLSTIIGSLFTYFKPKNINRFIGISLSFSGTIMIAISILELIPEGFIYLNNNYNLILAIFSLIGTFLLSKWLVNQINNKIIKREGEKSSLYKIGILNIIALMIHNLPEGILTFLTTSINTRLGLKIALAIILHNIPEGIAISIPIYYSTYSHKKSVVGTLLSGLSEPLGALLAYIILYRFINNTIISIILIFVGSIMITVSIDEIFQELNKYKLIDILIGTITGIIISILTIILL